MKDAAASTTQWMRIAATNQARLNAQVDLDEIKADHSTTKQTMREREEALLEAIAAARDAKSKNPLAAILELEADYRRAVNKFEVTDREKRRLEDAVRKATERTLALIEEAVKGPDLFEGTAKPADAYKSVLVGDICTEVIGKAAADVDIRTVGDVIDKWADLQSAVKRKDLPANVANYIGVQVAAFLTSQGVKVPKALADLKPVKLQKLATEELEKAQSAAEKAEDADDSDEARTQRMKKLPPFKGLKIIVGDQALPEILQNTFGYLYYQTGRADPYWINRLDELREEGWGTPELFLARTQKMFEKFPEPKEAIEALPADISLKMLVDLVKFAYRELEDDIPSLVTLANVGAANIDAFLQMVGGTDSKLNELRVKYERLNLGKPKGKKKGD